MVSLEYTALEIAVIRNEVRAKGPDRVLCPRDGIRVRWYDVISREHDEEGPYVGARQGKLDILRASVECPKCYAGAAQIRFQRQAPDEKPGATLVFDRSRRSEDEILSDPATALQTGKGSVPGPEQLGRSALPGSNT